MNDTIMDIHPPFLNMTLYHLEMQSYYQIKFEVIMCRILFFVWLLGFALYLHIPGIGIEGQGYVFDLWKLFI